MRAWLRAVCIGHLIVVSSANYGNYVGHLSVTGNELCLPQQHLREIQLMNGPVIASNRSSSSSSVYMCAVFTCMASPLGIRRAHHDRGYITW